MQAANILHAGGESSPGNLGPGTIAVVLAAPGERELEDAAARLSACGIPHVRICEPDPPYGGALMALGVVPARKEDVRRALSSLPLLR